MSLQGFRLILYINKQNRLNNVSMHQNNYRSVSSFNYAVFWGDAQLQLRHNSNLALRFL